MGKQRISRQQAYENIGKAFRSNYGRSSALDKAASTGLRNLSGQASAATLGHPEHMQLQPGETRSSTAVVTFVDIRGFTKMSFVTSPEDLVRIVQALTEASIRAIIDGGGYVGEFTGDGVMAYFGDSSSTDTESVTAAIETASLLFKTVDEIVNPELEDQGLTPIRIAAGMEYGEVLWSRVGTGATSQIKPIGVATFLAGKLCSNETLAWECKVGAELAKWVPDGYKTKTKQYGPFTVKGTEISRELYLLNWRVIANETLLNQAAFEDSITKRRLLFGGLGSAASTTKVVDPPKPGTPGPRPLKDQPFFGE